MSEKCVSGRAHMLAQKRAPMALQQFNPKFEEKYVGVFFSSSFVACCVLFALFLFARCCSCTHPRSNAHTHRHTYAHTQTHTHTPLHTGT